MKKSYIVALLVLVLAAVWMYSGTLRETPAVEIKPKVEKAVPSVRVQAMQAQEFKMVIALTGRTEPFRLSRVGAEVAGTVEATPVEYGRFVKKGEVVVRLNVNERKAALEESQKAFEQAEIEYNAASALAERGYNSEIRLATTKANLESAKRRVIEARLNLGHTSIKAPFDGILESREVEVGSYVNVGDMVFTVVQLNPIKIVGFVPETQVPDIVLGSKARIVFVHGEEIDADVTFISSKASEQTRTFRIELQAPNGDSKIIAGLTAEIRIEGKTKNAHFISPAFLSLRDSGEVGVKALDTENRVVFYPVRIISNQTDGIWISGVPETFNLITVGHEFVVEGQIIDTHTTDVEAEKDI